MQDTIRIFFAIILPKDISHSVIELIDLLKKHYPSIKWTRHENLHLTLQFLPAVHSEDLDSLITHVHQELLTARPFQIQFDQLELFPTIYRPTVISLRATPNEPQAELATLIGNGISTAHYKTEHRSFRSHLTLARLDRSRKTHIDLSQFRIPTNAFCVDSVTLFKSELSKTGSRYSILHTFNLASF